MFKRAVALVLLLIAIYPLTYAQDSDSHHLRLAQLSPQFPEVNVLLDNELILESVPFDSFSQRVEIPSGDHEILITDTSNTTVIGPIPFNLAVEGWSTLVLTGTITDNNLNLQAVNEQMVGIPVNLVRLHVFNMADNSVLRVQAGEESLTEIPFNTPVFFAEFSYNAYEKITLFHDEQPLFDITPTTPHRSYLLIATRINGDIHVLSDETDLGTRFRLAHFAPDVPRVDVLLNGQPALQNVAYESFTDVIDIPYGTYELTLVSEGQELLPPQQVTFAPDEISTLVFSGQSGNLMSQLIIQNPPELADNTALMAGQNALVEVRHTISDAPPIDVLLADGTVLIEGLPYGETIGVLDLPTGTYDLLITVSGEPDTVLYERPATLLEGGKIYWMTLIGRYNEVILGRQRLNWVSVCVLPQGCE